VIKRFNSIVGDMPEAQTQFTIIGGGLAPPNAAFRGYVLKPWGERDRTIREIKKDLDAKLKNLPGAQAYPMLNSGLPGVGQGLPVQFVVRGVGSPAQVYEVAEKIKAKALESRKFVFMIDSANFDAPRSTVDVDRDKAAALGVPVSDVGTTLSTLVGENWVSRFDQDNRSYEVIPQVREQDRSDPSVLDRYYVRSAEGSMVPLSALTKVSTSGAPASIEQFNQLNSATLQGVGLGLTVSEGLKVLGDIARDVMPDGFFIDYIGEGRLASQEGSSLAVTFIFAVLIIYLVLAAQFESFRDPLIILIAVPFSIFGAMVPLNLLGPLGSNGATLNIYSELGLITLVGLIAKHGILLVRFANDRRAEGVDMHDAILEAAHVRLRPILMTTAAMVLGVFPLLVASGAGAGARFSIGLVIFSGMAIGTVFTLFVVPVFYTFIAHKDAPLAAAPRIRPQAEEIPSPKARAAE
jgi:multidrug efflux pump